MSIFSWEDGGSVEEPEASEEVYVLGLDDFLREVIYRGSEEAYLQGNNCEVWFNPSPFISVGEIEFTVN